MFDTTWADTEGGKKGERKRLSFRLVVISAADLAEEEREKKKEKKGKRELLAGLGEEFSSRIPFLLQSLTACRAEGNGG